MKEQPEAALTRSIGEDERRRLASSRLGSLACKEATLDQDEGRNGTRRGRDVGSTDRGRSPLHRRG